MQVINKKIIIVIFICLSIFIFGLYKLFNKKEIELDNVILDIQKQNNTFAIYVEEGKNNYNEKEIFPEEGYVLNEEKSQCMSIDGNIIENILSYDYENKKLIVDTTESINCYLYFDKGAGLEIIGKGPNGLNLETNSSDANWTGMYRFQGQQSENIENYICFGTSDSNECKEHPDKYMYRIIGIEENGRIKVIKKEALENIDNWWSDNLTTIHWHESLVFEHINGETFLNKKEYVPEGWEDKIDDNNWLFGSMNASSQIYGAGQNGLEVYKIESGQKIALWNEKANGPEDEYKGVKALFSTGYYYIQHLEKWNETELPHEKNAKIGLMYISDYYLSVSNEANCQGVNSIYKEICKNGWMHLSQNDDTIIAARESTMTRYGWSSGDANFGPNFIHIDGYESYGFMNWKYSIRPVFFLKNNVSLIYGIGTIDNPFIIQ